MKKCIKNEKKLSMFFIKGTFQVGEWGQKMAFFDDLQYCKSSEVDGPKKVKNKMT